MITQEKITNDIRQLTYSTAAFIGGRFEAGHQFFSKKSPIKNLTIREITECDKALVNKAITYAKASFESGVWRNLRLKEKKKILFELADKIESSRYEISLLDTMETGRSFKNYYEDSIPKAIEVIRWFAEAADKYLNEALELNPKFSANVYRIPLGVVTCITPWNDPLVPAMWKMVPALLMGNSVIMKPAEESTLSMLKLASLARDVGIPDGVLQVLPGRGQVTGDLLVTHPEMNGIFFTGSTQTGKEIYKKSADLGFRKVSLECGGKSAFVISQNCLDLKTAVRSLCRNMFYNQGQICSAPSRAIIHRSLRGTCIEELKEEILNWIPSHPFNPNSKVSCIVSEEQYKKVCDYIQEGEKISELTIRGEGHDDQYLSVNPVVFIAPDRKSKVYRDEIFGPVLCVSFYDDFSEAIHEANDTEYGLAASIWTDSLQESHRFINEVHAGIIHVNSYGEDDMSVPFGGFKNSGMGVERSFHAFNEFSQLKTVWSSHEK